ncbi:MAG: peptidyl-prolyl cis-trans isomerase [Acidobacteria bacterium]|nr:peptidyl-prolyl cis-trans isomerase [Acidobacteriota bacterium]
MIKILRENTFARNAILYFVVILLAAYVLVALGQAPATVQSDVVTKIGTQEIRIGDIQSEKIRTRERYAQYPEQYRPKDEQLNMLASSSIITNALIAQAAQDAGVAVSDDELRDYIIKSRTREDGSYMSDEDYRAAVTRQYGGVAVYEHYIRESVLRNSKFQLLFSDSVYVSDSEMRERFEEDGKLLNADMINLNIYAFREESKIEDKDLEKFYQANKDEFMSGPQRKIRYAFFANKDFSESAVPTDAEIQTYYDANKERPPYFQATRYRAHHILIKEEGRSLEEAKSLIDKAAAELAAGKAFDEVAKTYSDDATNKDRGGDLGFFSKGQYANTYGEVFETKVLGMKEGDVSEPFKAAQGWHIVRLDTIVPEKQQTLEEAKPNISQILKNEKGKTLAQEAAAKLHGETVAGKTLSEAASAQNVTLADSDFFDRNNFSMISQTLGSAIKLKNEAFAATEKEKDAKLVDVGVGFVVFEWLDERDAVVLEFDPASPRIKQMAEQAKGRNLLKQNLEKVAAKLKSQPEITLEELKKEFSFLNDSNCRTTNQFGAKGMPFQLTRAEVSFDDLYARAQGDLVGPIYGKEVANDGYLLRITEKLVPDETAFEAQREQLLAQIRQEKSLEVMTTMLEGLRTKLDPNGSRFDKIQEVCAKIN